MKNKKIVDVIIEIGSNHKLLDKFLIDILTPTEYEEINKRWEIVKMLSSGVNQHEIAKKLGVGIATVTRGSTALKNTKGGFREILKYENHI